MRRFASRACAVRWWRRPENADAVRRQRTIAGRAAAKVRLQRSIVRASRYPSKSAAFNAGYRLGYTRMWRYWSKKYARLQAQLPRKVAA